MQQKTTLLSLPNESLFEILQFYASSPASIELIACLICKTFLSVVRQYEQQLYGNLCAKNSKELYYLKTKQFSNFKLHYIMNCLCLNVFYTNLLCSLIYKDHFIQKIVFDPPKQSIFDQANYCNILSFTISSNIPFLIYENALNQFLNDPGPIFLDPRRFYVYIEFDAKECFAKGLEFSNLIRETPFTVKCINRQFLSAYDNYIEIDDIFNTKGVLTYEIFVSSFYVLGFRYGKSELKFSEVLLLKREELSSKVKSLLTNLDQIQQLIEQNNKGL